MIKGISILYNSTPYLSICALKTINSGTIWLDLLFCLFSISSIQAQKFMENFVDSTDHAFGISMWLSIFYSFPVASLITEPATGYGAAFGLIHLSKRKEVNFEGKPVPSDLSVFGVGIRYLLARKFNIYSGIDVARGSEEGAYYIQFGHYWNSL